VVETEKVEPKKENVQKTFMSEQDAQTTTDSLIMIVESFATNLLGDDAKLNMTESIMLRTSLPPLLSSLEISVVEKTSKVLYPIAAITGFVMYGLRLSNMYKNKLDNEQAYTEQVYSQEESEPTNNTTMKADNGLWEQRKTIDFSQYAMG